MYQFQDLFALEAFIPFSQGRPRAPAGVCAVGEVQTKSQPVVELEGTLFPQTSAIQQNGPALIAWKTKVLATLKCSELQNAKCRAGAGK